MIQLIEGSSGSGKSYLIYKEMIQASMENPEKNFFLIVPEQFTMQAQREVVTLHPRHGTMNIDIVSFNRLAYRVFEELNIRCENVLEDFGKSMLLQRILIQHRKELPVFGPCAQKSGFVDELKSLLTELFQYRISREDISQVYKDMQEENTLKSKLHDLLFIYDAFQDEIKGRYIIAEHILEMLANQVSNSDLLQGSQIYLDGYTGFTPIQYELLEALAQVSDSLTVTVTIDQQSVEAESCEEHSLFYLSKDTIGRICRMAERLGVYIEERFLEGELPRFRNAKELEHLEKNLFRYPYQTWQEEEINQIHIQIMSDPRQELRKVARQMRQMVRKEGYRYQDFAVIHGNLEQLEPLVEEIFPRLEIPYFIDTNQSIYMNPCLECIRGLLDIILQDYSYESVFRFLKTGVTKISRSQIERLENHVIRKGIRGYAFWKQTFSALEEQEVESLQEQERALDGTYSTGVQVIELLGPVTEALKQKKTVQDYVDILIGFLEGLNLEQQLEYTGDFFEENGNLVQARAYRQIYGKLSDILEKLVAILGDQEMKLEEFKTILETGFDHISLGVIPPSLDQVTLGDIERTRLNRVKVLFVLGVNDGIIPRITKGGGILSETDRSCLSQSLELAPDSRSRVFTEQFYLYQNVTKPSEKLFLTYHVQDIDGNEVLPAYLIGRIHKLFPKLIVQDFRKEEVDWESVETPKDSMDLFIHSLNKEMELNAKDIWNGLYSYYQAEQPQLLEQIRKGTLYNNIEKNLSKETAALLYGDILNTSVTRLETYSKCPYRFFLEYGLHLRKRERNEVTLGDMGTLLHHVMEKVFSQVEKKNSEKLLMETEEESIWTSISDEELQHLVEQEIQKEAEQEDSIYQYSHANRQQLARIQKIATYAVADLKQQLLTGKMTPYEFELTFNRQGVNSMEQAPESTEFLLESGVRMRLNGIIDRIDIYQEEDRIYVKVLDYKSSSKEIEMDKVDAGLQLQLLVYTDVALEILKKRFPDKEIIPAASLYYGFQLPMVEKLKNSERLMRKISRETALTGVMNQEEPCPALLGNLDILPGKEKKVDGVSELEESEHVLSEANYRALLKQTRKTITTIGSEMVEGKISIRPIQESRGNTCTYCDYQDVCKLDCRDGGNQVFTVTQLKNAQKGDRSHGMDQRTESGH